MKREHRSHVDQPTIDTQGTITVKTWDPAILRLYIPWWDALTDSDRLAELQALERDIESTTITKNISLNGLLAHIANALNPIASSDATTSHLALGTATDDPQPDGDSLGTEVYRTIVGDADTDGSDLLVSAILSQTEANGYTITEIGLAGGPDEDDALLTHALLDVGQEIEKNTKMVVTFDYILEFRRPTT